MLQKQLFWSMLLSSVLTVPSVHAWRCCAQQEGVCGTVCCDQVTQLSDPAAHCGQVVLTESNEQPLAKILLPEPDPTTESENTTILLYHWQSPDGQQHYSVMPPHWYRNPNYPNHYPRIKVYDQHHTLVDDTSIPLKRNLARDLRQQAYTLADYYQQMRQQHAQAQQAIQQLQQQQAELQSLIAQNKIALNMSPDQVQAAWGQYQAQKIETMPEGNQVTWFYGEDEQQWVIFLNGSVIDFRTITETEIDFEP